MVPRWVVAGTAKTLSQRSGLEFVAREVRWSRLRSWGATLGQPGAADLEREAKMSNMDNTTEDEELRVGESDGV